MPTRKTSGKVHGPPQKKSERIMPRGEDEGLESEDKSSCESGNEPDAVPRTYATSIFDLGQIDDPLIGTPKEVQIELDNLAIYLQRNPDDEDAFSRIHTYIHKYLLGLVFKKFNFVKGYEETDMYQEALIALFKKAIPKFKRGKGMSFLNFAKMCINRHLITILHASKHRRKDMPINTAISLDHAPPDQEDDASCALSNVITDDKNADTPFKEMFRRDMISHTLSILRPLLSKFEIIVLEEYLMEKRYKEIAKNVSRRLGERYNEKSVDNALLRIRKKATELRDEKGDDLLPILS